MKYILQSLDWDTDKTLAIFGYEEDDIRVDPTDREKSSFSQTLNLFVMFLMTQ